jgi:PAS domain-containing protein
VEEQIIMDLISSEDFAKICKTPEGKEVMSKLQSPSRSRLPLNLPRDVTDVNITPEAFIITYKGTEFVFRNPQAESIFKRRRPTREEGLEILAACPEIVEAIKLLYEERQSTKEVAKERIETEAKLESTKKERNDGEAGDKRS